jgi:hypothetical protein
MCFGDFIGKAIAKIQARGMHTFSPALISPRNPPGGGRCDRDDIEAKSVDQLRHLLCDVPACRDDQRFHHGSGGNQNLGFAFRNFMQASGPAVARAAPDRRIASNSFLRAVESSAGRIGTTSTATFP